jgi:hypothetical protein
MKPPSRARCEWALWSHAYLLGEMRVGEIIFLIGVWTMIMSLPKRFHGDVGGTRDVYGSGLGMDFRSRSPSFSMIGGKSSCERREGRGGEEGGCLPFRLPLVGDVGGAATLRFVRVGACADELRLMGVERDKFSIGGCRGERRRCSLASKSSSACAPPSMERMWRGPCGDGAKCTMHFVESGGRLRDRRCALLGRLVATKGVGLETESGS